MRQVLSILKGSITVGTTEYKGFSVAIGNHAAVDGTGSVAIGNGSNAEYAGATATGYGAKATAESASAFGRGAQATAKNASAYGYGAQANGESSFAAGDQANAKSNGAVAIGNHAAAGSDVTFDQLKANIIADAGTLLSTANINSINAATDISELDEVWGAAINDAKNAGKTDEQVNTIAKAFELNRSKDGLMAVAIGEESSASGEASVATGYKAKTTDFNGVAVGSYAASLAQNTIAIGKAATVSDLANSGVAIGTESYVADNAEGAVVLGQKSRAFDRGATALGSQSVAVGEYSTSVGAGSNVSGYGAAALGLQSSAVGEAATSAGESSTAAGKGAAAYGANALAGVYSYDAVVNDDGYTGTFAGMDIKFYKNEVDANGKAVKTEVNMTSIDGAQAAYLTAYNNAHNAAIAEGKSPADADQIASKAGLNAVVELIQDKGANALAMGANAGALAKDATALGASSLAKVEGAVALGSGSVANRTADDTKNGVKFNYYDGAQTLTVPTKAEANIGGRVLGGVAAGVDNTDAVNVGQWKTTAMGTSGDTGEGNVNLFDERFAVNGDGKYISTAASDNKITITFDEDKLKANDLHITPTAGSDHNRSATYAVDNNGNVTLEYSDGTGATKSPTAVISGIASRDWVTANDKYVTGGTVSYNNNGDGTATLNINGGSTVTITRLTDKYVSSVAQSGNNVTVTRNDGTSWTFTLPNAGGSGTMNSFNVAGNGAKVDSIADGNTVNFANGSNTTANVTTDDNGTVTVTYDLNDNVVLGKDGKDGQPGTAGSIGIKGKDGADGKDGYIGLDGKDGISIKGKDGKDGISIKGNDGADGKQGSIGIRGADGINGKDGADSLVEFTVSKGVASLVDAKNIDQNTMARLVYEDSKGKHEVATMDDGHKFSDGTNTFDTTLNNTVTFQAGETVTGNAATKNVSIEATQDDEDSDVVYNVKLNKDINLGADGSVTTGNTVINNGGLTIGKGSTSYGDIIINQGKVSYGGNQITNVASGNGTGLYDNTVQGQENYNNVATIGDVQTISKANDTNTITKITAEGKAPANATYVGGNIQANVTTDAKGNMTYDVKLNNELNLTKGGSVTIGDTFINNDGVKVGNDVSLTKDGLVIKDGPSVTKDGIDAGSKQVTNVASGTTGETWTAGDFTKLPDNVKEGDLNNAANIGDVINLAGDIAQETTKAGRTEVTAEGKAPVANSGEYVGKNIQVKVDETKSGKLTYDLKLGNDITIGGKDGQDGKDGVDGKIGVAGKDGENGVTISAETKPGKDGKDGVNGHIGLTGNQGVAGKDGKDGVDGKDVSADITVRNGHDGVDGKNGADGMTRIVYEDKGGEEHEVATLDDGMKYSGDSGDQLKMKLNENVNIKGGATGTLSEGNIGVVADGKDTLTVKLADDIKVNSVTANEFKTKNVTINNDGIDAGDTNITNVKSGIVNGDDSDNTNAANIGDVKQIANQAAGNIDNKINKLSNRMDKGLAGAAALAALHPLDFDPDDKLTFAAGIGNYRGENAGAIGMFYRPDEKVMFSLGATVGNDDNMVNAGVSFSLDRTARVTNSKTAMAREILDMRAEMAELKAMVNNMGAWMGVIDEYRNVLFPDVPENHWAYEYVEMLANRGIIEGYPNGRFDGDRSMTRYEFAALLARALQKGAVLSDAIEKEFGPELSRIRVDRIAGEDGDKRKIERIRVNGDKYDEAGNQIERRDHYGTMMPVQQTSAK